MLQLTQLNNQLWFPDISLALDDPNGLLAFGGDLTVERLLLAYQNGIFPWFGEDEPIMWWSPDPRGVIYVEDFKASKSLRKHIRKVQPHVTLNKCFEKVISLCANVPRNDNGTWITESMLQAYINLHHQGHAHSVEVWINNQLAGGLYGVYCNNMFCGESMFSLQSNSSKIALTYLIDFLNANHIPLLDCQMQNPHLQKLGCVTLPRSEFAEIINTNKKLPEKQIDWSEQTLMLT